MVPPSCSKSSFSRFTYRSRSSSRLFSNASWEGFSAMPRACRPQAGPGAGCLARARLQAGRRCVGAAWRATQAVAAAAAAAATRHAQTPQSPPLVCKPTRIWCRLLEQSCRDLALPSAPEREAGRVQENREATGATLIDRSADAGAIETRGRQATDHHLGAWREVSLG